MEQYMVVIWFVVVIVAALIEINTMDLTSIWFSVGALFAFVIAIVEKEAIPLQFIAFLVVTGGLLLAVRPIARNYLNYNVYKEGAEYSWHSDGSDHSHNFDQKYTVLINLSEQPYEGGEFDLFDNGPQEMKFTSGDILMFTSHMPHRVRPVTKGERITLTYWMVGPKFQ